MKDAEAILHADHSRAEWECVTVASIAPLADRHPGVANAAVDRFLTKQCEHHVGVVLFRAPSARTGLDRLAEMVDAIMNTRADFAASDRWRITILLAAVSFSWPVRS